MDKDVYVSTIKSIRNHPNADTLEIADVLGYQCLIKKDEMKPGDKVVFIAPDAKLPEMQEQKWVEPYERFISSSRRVKTIKLRGEFSEGIVISFKTLEEFIKSDETVQEDLGVTHWEDPRNSESNFAKLRKGSARSWSLPYGITKTDQHDVQKLDKNEILGKNYIVTHKHDGMSGTITFEINRSFELVDFHITSRNVDLKVDEPVVYHTATKNVVDMVNETIEKLKSGNFSEPHVLNAKNILDKCFEICSTENLVLVIRGEVCGQGICNRKVNADSKVSGSRYYVFEEFVSDTRGKVLARNNIFKQESCAFFTPVYENGLFQNVVSIEDYLSEFPKDGLTEEYIDKFLERKAELGEGVVLWEVVKGENGEDVLTGSSFKIKSKEYATYI